MSADPITISNRTGKFIHRYGGRESTSFNTKREAARHYVANLVLKEPKYKPLFEGKTWEEIYKMVGIIL